MHCWHTEVWWKMAVFLLWYLFKNALDRNHINVFQLSLCLRKADDNVPVDTLRPRQNGHRFADDTFKRIFLNENVSNSIKISLKFVPKGPINNNPTLVQIMAWRRSGDKPLSELMMVSLLTHICVTRPQWVNVLAHISWYAFYGRSVGLVVKLYASAGFNLLTAYESGYK